MHCAAAEVGQGVIEVILQDAPHASSAPRRCRLAPATTASVGSAGSASASRMTWMAAGAVQLACRAALAELGGRRRQARVDIERVYRHPPTAPLDPETGQVTGERAHVAFACAAMQRRRGGGRRARPDAGRLDRDCARTWAARSTRTAVEGQIEGGTAQGLGLALMEEIQTRDGLIRNASFTDYLIPTTLDMPPVESVLIEDPEPDAPYGVKGVGELRRWSRRRPSPRPLRDATGKPLTRVPVRPDEIVGLA